jgi:phospholipid N-methyltransferase
MKNSWTFFKEFKKNFHHTGAILPSSRGLGNALAHELELLPHPKSIIEIGAGTGAVTECVLNHIRPGDRLVLVEVSDRFCDLLQKHADTDWKSRLQGVDFKIESKLVQDLKYNQEFDYAVSGLPLNNFDSETVKEILKCYQKFLKPGGGLAYFEYLWVRKVKRPMYEITKNKAKAESSDLLDQFIGQYQSSRTNVYMNMPPAVARRFRFHSHVKK